MIRGPIQGQPGALHSLERVRQGSPIGVANRQVIEAGAARRRRRASFALPGIQPNVVVVPTGGHERRLGPQPLG